MNTLRREIICFPSSHERAQTFVINKYLTLRRAQQSLQSLWCQILHGDGRSLVS